MAGSFTGQVLGATPTLRLLNSAQRQDLAPYLQAFRYGMPSHGGFAIGLERLVARLAGPPNIRQATLFPRDLNRLDP